MSRGRPMGRGRRRRGRGRRLLLIVAASACGTLGLLGVVGGADGGQAGTRAGAAQAGGERPAGRYSRAMVERGQDLFESSCASCHGMGAQGIPGRGPSLHGVGALAADFYLQTGRMPLASSQVQPMRNRPAFPQSQIQALIAYVASFGGPAVPVVQPRRGSTSRGQQLFALDCAGCHTIQGQGGIVTGAIVPSLGNATPRQIDEALRIGPYAMPRFDAADISAREVDSIARYIRSTQHPDDRGGWSLGRIGPIPEGMVAWLLAAVALLLIARLLGERAQDPPPGRPR